MYVTEEPIDLMRQKFFYIVCSIVTPNVCYDYKSLIPLKTLSDHNSYTEHSFIFLGFTLF